MTLTRRTQSCGAFGDVTLVAIRAAMGRRINPDKITIVISGDLSKPVPWDAAIASVSEATARIRLF